MTETDLAVLAMAVVCAIGTWGICVLVLDIKRQFARWLWTVYSEVMTGIAREMR